MAYVWRISDWSSDVCSSDLACAGSGLDPNAPALVLFTSGSEGEPKGVVLSHDNLLANCRQLAARIDFNPTDSVLNALPVFHSFGMTGGMLLPLFSGVKTFMYPSRSEEHTSELQSTMRNSYAVFCLKKNKKPTYKHTNRT